MKTIPNLSVEGYTYSIPANGEKPDTIVIKNDNGKIPTIRAVIADNFSDVYLTLGPMGNKPRVNNVALSTLHQDRPVPINGGAGSWDMTLRNTSANAYTVHFALIIEWN
jgi:hypothetical protein